MFCDQCGTRLEVACAGCGETNRVGAKFCKRCGQALAAAAAPVAAPRFGPPETYTPKHLAEKILTSRGALEGERKQVTVLFADIKGSMELLADRDPEEARRILDPVLERMMEAVHHYEGTVNQVMGDGIMALFGAPLAHEDHAVRACYAALRMQAAVTRYGDEVRRTHGVPVQIRVGLNSGEVVVRAIGNDLHMDYTAVGQTTHLAARMEQMARPGAIFATPFTLQLAEGFVEVTPLGPVPVKGLEAPVNVAEVVAAVPVRSRMQAGAARGLTGFVGRGGELAQLGEALELAQAGEGQLVALVGDAGVGKSRLLYELVRSPRTEGWRVLETAAVSYGKGSAYQPVIDLLRGYFRIESRDDTAAIQGKVAEGVAMLGQAPEDAAPAVEALLEALSEDHPFRALEPSARRQRVRAGIVGLLLRLSQTQPLLLIVENLQWIDSETQALLDELIVRLPGASVLLVVSYRPEYRPDRPRPPYGTEIQLDVLPRESALALLDDLLGPTPKLAPLMRHLIERTGGNPFFLEESVRTLVETRALEGERGAYRVTKPLQTIQLPATVQAILASRIDRLPPEDKRLLQAASVIGKDLPVPLVHAIAEMPEEALHRSLTHLQAAAFIHETSLFPELEYTFVQALTHEVTYASVLHGRRRALHGRIVEAIEALYSHRLIDRVERLAHHAFQGEVWAKALTYSRQAGVKAVAHAANREAVLCFEQALAALERLPESRDKIEQGIDLRLDLRPPLLQLGRLDAVLALSQEAERMAKDLGDRERLARVYTYLINYHYLTGEFPLALDYGERCLAIGETGNDLALQALASRYMGHIYHAQGQYRRAEFILRRILEELEGAEPTDASVSYVASSGWLAFTLAEVGEFDRAYTCLDKVQRAAAASPHAYSQAIAWALMGLVWMRRGDLEQAVPLLERSLQVCVDKQLAVWQPIPSSLLGLVLTLLGRTDEGVRLLEAGVTLSENLGVKAYLALWMVQLGEGQLIAGRPEQALATAQRALDCAVALGERGHQAWALRLLGAIAAHGAVPDLETAAASYARAMAVAEEIGMRPLRARCHLGLGEIARRQEHRPQAEEHLTSAITLFFEMGMRFWLKQTEKELAALGHLCIVARNHLDLYDLLKREFADASNITVVLDRRHGERRLAARAKAGERRGGDRRNSAEIDELLRARGIVIVG